MKIRYTSLAVACVMAMTVAATAQAAPITYTFGGTLGTVDAVLSPLAAGDTFTGTFSIESTAADLGSPTQGVYAAGYSMNVTVHGYTYSSTGGDVWVFHDGISGDVFIAGDTAALFGGVTNVTGPSLGGLLPYGFGFGLYSNSSHLFNSTALPSNLSLSSFDRLNVFEMIFDSGSAFAFGTVTSLTQVTAAPVPEASTSAMLALGLGALAVARRRQRS